MEGEPAGEEEEDLRPADEPGLPRELCGRLGRASSAGLRAPFVYGLARPGTGLVVPV
jgi:hypothetical protein